MQQLGLASLIKLCLKLKQEKEDKQFRCVYCEN